MVRIPEFLPGSTTAPVSMLRMVATDTPVRASICSCVRFAPPGADASLHYWRVVRGGQVVRGLPAILAAGESDECRGDVVEVVDKRDGAARESFPVFEGVLAFGGAGCGTQADLDVRAFFALKPGVPVRTAQAPHLASISPVLGSTARPPSQDSRLRALAEVVWPGW